MKTTTQKTPSGKSLLKGEISLKEIRSLLSASKLDKDIIEDYLKDSENSQYDTYVWDGDFEMDGDWDPFSSNVCNLIILGNMTIKGLMTFYDDPATFIFIKGNLTAQNLVAADTLEVCGNLTVENVLLCKEPKPLYVHGDLSAGLFFPFDAELSIGGKKNVKKAWNYPHRITKKKEYPYITNRELYLLLKDAAFTEPVGMEKALAIAKKDWDDADYFEYLNDRGLIGMLVKRVDIYR